MSGVRQAAVGVLLRLEGGRTTLAAELERAREGLDDRRDRGLLVELATGTLRWQQELDALITAASRRPASGIDPPARAVLRLGAYQLRHLDRIPVHAVVHESVETVRAVGAPKAAGFVNAVLRTLIRRGLSLKLPARPGPGDSEERSVAYLSVTLSHPEWLVRRWLGRYGFDATERWCVFNNTAPEIAVRPIAPLTPAALLTQLHEHGIGATPAPFVSDAIRLAPGALGRVPPEVNDALAVQDEGSQLVARFAGATPNERVLDVCAAPGGKTLILAGDLGIGDARHHSVLIAGDGRLARVRLLSARLRRAGLDIPVVALDALRPLPFGPVFDCVFVDAPCSGLGTLRRDPDLKWSRREEDLPRLVADQRRMLKSAADLVRPGGRLIYATCSSEPEENGGVVGTFLHRDARFAAARPPESVRVPADVLDSNGRLVTEPFRHGLDAYFAARLVRREGT